MSVFVTKTRAQLVQVYTFQNTHSNSRKVGCGWDVVGVGRGTGEGSSGWGGGGSDERLRGRRFLRAFMI